MQATTSQPMTLQVQHPNGQTITVTEEQFALAGIDISKPVESITQEQFQRILDVVGQQQSPQQQTTTFANAPPTTTASASSAPSTPAAPDAGVSDQMTLSIQDGCAHLTNTHGQTVIIDKSEVERIGVTYNARGQPDIQPHHIEQLAQMALMALEASVQRSPCAYTNGIYRNQYQQQGVGGQSPHGTQWQPTTTAGGNAPIGDPLQMATDGLFDATPATTQSPQVVTSAPVTARTVNAPRLIRPLRQLPPGARPVYQLSRAPNGTTELTQQPRRTVLRRIPPPVGHTTRPIVSSTPPTIRRIGQPTIALSNTGARVRALLDKRVQYRDRTTGRVYAGVLKEVRDENNTCKVVSDDQRVQWIGAHQLILSKPMSVSNALSDHQTYPTAITKNDSACQSFDCALCAKRVNQRVPAYIVIRLPACDDCAEQKILVRDEKELVDKAVKAARDAQASPSNTNGADDDVKPCSQASSANENDNSQQSAPSPGNSGVSHSTDA